MVLAPLAVLHMRIVLVVIDPAAPLLCSSPGLVRALAHVGGDMRPAPNCQTVFGGHPVELLH
jgi:hypothetical protein